MQVSTRQNSIVRTVVYASAVEVVLWFIQLKTTQQGLFTTLLAN